MIGIDGATVARPQSPASFTTPLPEALDDLESEFFVEWQVADDDLLATAAREANSL